MEKEKLSLEDEDNPSTPLISHALNFLFSGIISVFRETVTVSSF